MKRIQIGISRRKGNVLWEEEVGASCGWDYLYVNVCINVKVSTNCVQTCQAAIRVSNCTHSNNFIISGNSIFVLLLTNSISNSRASTKWNFPEAKNSCASYLQVFLVSFIENKQSNDCVCCVSVFLQQASTGPFKCNVWVVSALQKIWLCFSAI